MRPTQGIEIFGNVLRHLVRWTSIDFEVKFYEDRFRGNRGGVAKYSEFGPLQDYIWKTVQGMR